MTLLSPEQFLSSHWLISSRVLMTNMITWIIVYLSPPPPTQQKPMTMVFVSLSAYSWDHGQWVQGFVEKKEIREVGPEKVTAPVGFVRQQECILLTVKSPVSHGRRYLHLSVGLVWQQEQIALIAKSPVSYGRRYPPWMCLAQVDMFDVKWKY